MYVPVYAQQGRTVGDLFHGASTVVVLGGGFLGHAVVKLLKRQLRPDQMVKVADDSPAITGTCLDEVNVQSVEEIVRSFSANATSVLYCTPRLLDRFQKACAAVDLHVRDESVFSMRTLQQPRPHSQHLFNGSRQSRLTSENNWTPTEFSSIWAYRAHLFRSELSP